MSKVSKILGLAICVIAVIVLAALALMKSFHSAQDVIDFLLMAVSLAVAAVPEGLTAIMTVYWPWECRGWPSSRHRQEAQFGGDPRFGLDHLL